MAFSTFAAAKESGKTNAALFKLVTVREGVVSEPRTSVSPLEKRDGGGNDECGKGGGAQCSADCMGRSGVGTG
jgi:hypothetical protein